MSDLFSHREEQLRARIAPLADRMRPRSLDDFVGQEMILGPGRLLRRAITADRVGSLILHGPPGTGKTTLARIIARTTRAHFSSLNAVLAGVKDLRAEVDAARQRLGEHGLRTILFIDEVHRFNTAQQDALLPWVENGTLTLIGATTENPCFEVNKALVSRSRLFRLQPLDPVDLHRLLRRALEDADHGYGEQKVILLQEAADHLVNVAGGDARSLLNALELAVETTPPDSKGCVLIDLAIAEESIQKRAVLYDKQGDAHFDTISAFIKSLRGSDPDAALFWLARMVEAGEDARFIFRRMLIAAGEDVGLADPSAMVVVEACASAFERVGLPEGLYPLAQAALYLAAAEKSNSTLGFFDAVKAVRVASRQQVPSHLRDANRDGQAFGDGVAYRYPHAYVEHWVAQQYLPTSLQGEVFWQPGALGWEGQLRSRLKERRAAQMAAADEGLADQLEQFVSGPEDPLLARWVQRQSAAEGERFDRLRRLFWEGAGIGRLDRVLVFGARSLLWALDPLLAAEAGEVVITVAAEAERERLEGQLAVLDPLRRPQVLVVPPDRSGDPYPPLDGMAFEWIAARQPFLGWEAEAVVSWLERLSRLVSPSARARLLFSQPLLGPATSLGEHLHPAMVQRAAGSGASLTTAAKAALEEAMALEYEWLAGQGMGPVAVQECLADLGWRVEQRNWEESTELALGDKLLERWFAADSPYRTHLAGHLGPENIDALACLFRTCRGASLPQRLRHTLLLACWMGEGDGGPSKKPRSRGA